MKNKISITLSEHQMEVILKQVSPYILDERIENEFSSVIFQDEIYSISLTSDELEELIGGVSFIANQEKRKDKVYELYLLLDHLESYLAIYR